LKDLAKELKSKLLIFSTEILVNMTEKKCPSCGAPLR
jgi:uncharacterized Zn finger protein (UPF0148 family)